MSATELQFRGAVFGGFNRQDVLAYVEASTAEHKRRTEQLQQELGKAQEQYREQAASLAEMETRTARDAEENSRLSGELDELCGVLAEKENALAGAARELEALRGKVRELEPDAQAYDRIKERTASIELEAHLRAQRALDEANARIEESHAQVERWLMRVQSFYDRLCTDLEATASHVSGELGRLQTELGGVGEELAAHDGALKELLNCWRDGAFTEVPEQERQEEEK